MLEKPLILNKLEVSLKLKVFTSFSSTGRSWVLTFVKLCLNMSLYVAVLFPPHAVFVL